MPNPKDPEKLAAYRKKMSEIAKAKGYGKWMKGKKVSKETKAKQSKIQKEIGNTEEEKKRRSDRAKKLGYGKWMKGKTLPGEVKEKIGTVSRGKTFEERFGDKAEDIKRRIKKTNRETGAKRKRANVRPKHNGNYKYTEWRKSVFERDGYTCQGCSKIGGTLNAHHIYPWAKYPALRYVVSNGVTLCKKCHRIAGKCGWGGYVP